MVPIKRYFEVNKAAGWEGIIDYTARVDDHPIDWENVEFYVKDKKPKAKDYNVEWIQLVGMGR